MNLHVLRGAACVVCAMGVLTASTWAQIIEVEPNNSKATATPALLLDVGATITGSSTGATNQAGPNSADEFLVSTAGRPLGIYRWRLRLTSAQAHTLTLRGRNQVGGMIGTADVEVCTSSTATTPQRFVQWYGFGRSEQLYFAVSGSAATTLPYVATLEMQPVGVIDIGGFPNAGLFTFSWEDSGHMSDTDVWLYDSQFNAIPGAGNDDTNFSAGGSGSGTQSHLARTLANGTYHLAVSDYDLCNNLAAPADDDNRNGRVLDFPGAVVNSSIFFGNVTFRVTPPGPGGVGTLPRMTIPAAETESYQILFMKFTVGPVAPPCPADFNGNGVASVQDIFDFLSAFSNALSTADFNGANGITVQDIYDFLTAWTAGCP